MVFCMALAAAFNILHSEHGTISATARWSPAEDAGPYLHVGHLIRLYIFSAKGNLYIDFVSGVDTRSTER